MAEYFLHVTTSGIKRRPFEDFSIENTADLVGDETGLGGAEAVYGYLRGFNAIIYCDDGFPNTNWPIIAIINGCKFKGSLAIVGFDYDREGSNQEHFNGFTEAQCASLEALIELPKLRSEVPE